MICALLSAGCATTQAASDPAEGSGPTPLTASAALGDFGTVDYCSMLDVPKVAAGAVAVPTFESCQADLGWRTILVGPLAFDSDPNIKPYDYAGPVPDGVSVQQSMFNDHTACTRTIIFADGNRLDVSVTDSGPADQPGRCETADATVGSVLAAVTAGEGRAADVPRALVGPGRALRAARQPRPRRPHAAAGSQPTIGLAGHSCIRGKVGFKLTVDTAGTNGPVETLGGRAAQVRLAGVFCLVDSTQPAPGLPGRRELAEISVVETAGTAGDGTCALARTAATSIYSRLPKA